MDNQNHFTAFKVIVVHIHFHIQLQLQIQQKKVMHTLTVSVFHTPMNSFPIICAEGNGADVPLGKHLAMRAQYCDWSNTLPDWIGVSCGDALILLNSSDFYRLLITCVFYSMLTYTGMVRHLPWYGLNMRVLMAFLWFYNKELYNLTSTCFFTNWNVGSLFLTFPDMSVLKRGNKRLIFVIASLHHCSRFCNRKYPEINTQMLI